MIDLQLIDDRQSCSLSSRFLATKNGEITAALSEGYLVVPLHVFVHVKHFGDLDEDQSEFPDLIDERKGACGCSPTHLQPH